MEDQSKEEDKSSSDQGVGPDVLKTVLETYYTRGVGAADQARDRAQRGYTIASAVAAALVAAGAFSSLDTQPVIVQVLGIVAVAAWLVTALAFIRAVAVPTAKASSDGWYTADDFIYGVREQISFELDELLKRQRWALAATIVATTLTIVAFSVGLLQTGAEPARLELTPSADVAVRHLCGSQISTLEATVDPDSLDDPVVSVTTPPGECGVKTATVRLPKNDIVAEQKLPRFPRFP